MTNDNRTKMKTPTMFDVFALLQERGFTPAECTGFAFDLHHTSGGAVRVRVTDEDTPGYLRTEVKVETCPGSFELVAELTSFASIDLIGSTIDHVNANIFEFSTPKKAAKRR